MNTTFTINVQGEIRLPDIALLAQAMMGQPAAPTPAPTPASVPAPAPAPAPVAPAPVPAPMPPQPPVNPTPAPQAAPIPYPTTATTASPMTAPAPAPSVPAPSSPVVPGTEPPKFSIDDIARAGAELAQQGPDKITALTGLLQQFGLQAVTQLRPDQMGPFVLALRGLGARI